MIFSRSIVLAHISLLVGIAAFVSVSSGCAGSDDKEVVTAPQAPQGAVAKSDASKEHEAHEAEEAAEEAKEDVEAKEPAKSVEQKKESKPVAPKEVSPKESVTPPAGKTPPVVHTVAKAVTAPCATCHEDQTKAKHVVKGGVSCVTCHLGTPAHLEDPGVAPKIPSVRDDCFKCHAEAAKSHAPKQKANHGGKAACIKCHTVHTT